MTTLYGIKNCDTVKKARKWLDAQNIEYTFHDFRVDGTDIQMLEGWLNTISPSVLINKRSTTWKQLSDTDKAYFGNDPLPNQALEILLQSPTLIKRPVLEHGEQLTVGLDENEYNNIFR